LICIAIVLYSTITYTEAGDSEVRALCKVSEMKKLLKNSGPTTNIPGYLPPTLIRKDNFATFTSIPGYTFPTLIDLSDWPCRISKDTLHEVITKEHILKALQVEFKA
jgi:hypothetical protein